MKKRQLKKRVTQKGVSPLVATVLLIGFVIAVIVLVMLWGKNYIEERALKEGKLSEKKLECESIEVTVVNAYQQGGNAVVVVKNLKDKPIDKFIFRVIGEEAEPQESFEKLNSLEIKEYRLQFTEDIVGRITQLQVIPNLKVAPGVFVPCSSKVVKAKLLRT